MKQLGLIIFSIFLHFSLISVDIHVILPHYLNSRNLNPAFTGLHEHRYRLSLRAKDEWLTNAKSSALKYYQVGAEMKIAGWERDQLSTGMELRYSVLGSSRFASSAGVLAIAYTRQMAGNVYKKSGHFISMGVEYGFGQHSVNATDLIFGDQIDPDTGNPTGIPSQEQEGSFQAVFGDLNLGVLWYWLQENRFELASGVGIYHLTRPNISMLDGNVPLNIRWTGFLMAGYHVAPSLVLEPGLIMHWQEPHSTNYLGTNIRFTGMKEENFSFKTGIWMQGNVVDNEFQISFLHFLVSLGMQKLDIGFGYGLNLILPGQLVNDFRGLSMSMQYYFGRENRRYTLACPRF
ncbi:MAG TPA: hypothetical protein DCX89_08825 [Saprospirales bacterium]|nr:hypothetical protein [Saprospirales bacterium]